MCIDCHPFYKIKSVNVYGFLFIVPTIKRLENPPLQKWCKNNLDIATSPESVYVL